MKIQRRGCTTAARGKPPVHNNDPLALPFSQRLKLFARRLGAMVYDGLLLIALWLAAMAPVVALTGEHPSFIARNLTQVYLFLVGFAFFGGFWTHGGQTLGLRTWRLRVEDLAGCPVRWRRALGRYAAALLSWLPAGLGFLWILIDSRGRAWHDRLSATRVVYLPSSHPPQQKQGQ